MSCNITIPDFKSEKGEFEVSDKYKKLMRGTMSSESLYARSKRISAIWVHYK